ncbi:MAG TPA: DUF998 domain-containing protein [Propionibacteriaceae bacterium]|nr:DUF998 domain-containing protein [Propionibacteriaceae bacterium]
MTTLDALAPVRVRPTERSRVTSALLTGGIVAGPLFVTVSLTQALTREGFDLTRHAWSVLANGDLGWIQILNFLITGGLLVGLAVGLRRAWTSGPGRTWAPRLLGVHGLGMVAAGWLTADPSLGFPVGTPLDYRAVSLHGIGHMVAAMIAFLAVFACSLVVARRFAAEGRRGWARASRIVGVGFLTTFVALSASAGHPAAVVGFTVAVVVLMGWLAALAVLVRRDRGAN